MFLASEKAIAIVRRKSALLGKKTVDSIKQFTNNRFTVQSSASNSTDHNALQCHKTITLVTLLLFLLKLALGIKFKYLNAALRDRELVSR